MNRFTPRPFAAFRPIRLMLAGLILLPALSACGSRDADMTEKLARAEAAAQRAEQAADRADRAAGSAQAAQAAQPAVAEDESGPVDPNPPEPKDQAQDDSQQGGQDTPDNSA